jgi:hypothetical protein
MDHCLVVAKIRERIAVNKQGSDKFHMERFNLKKLHKVEVKDKYRVEVSNRFSIWNKKELPDQWKGYKTDCNNYCWISLVSASYKILPNILLSWLSPYIDEIIGDHQCGF